ncbi:MAG: MarR family transcriptional regulator, partial [Roseibacillus sp.]|nr:MarR family transcriptional regulator [Roseibacillus sp.]
ARIPAMALLKEKDWREMFRLRRTIVRAEQALSEIDRSILPKGLCESDLSILERLERKGARPVNGLARQVGLTSGSMTSAVQRLRRRGLVETRRDLEDKRVVWVSATPEAEKIVESFSQLRGEVLEEVFRKWSERERSVLINLLRRVRKDAGETRGATV